MTLAEFRAENDRFRALNAKLVMACEELIRYAEFAYPGVGPGDAILKARAVLAEAHEPQSADTR